MNFKILAAATLILTSMSAQSFAVPVTVFGEDSNPTGNPALATNATAARDSLFSNLASVGTETFDTLGYGATAPLASFGAVGTATLSGGVVQGTPDLGSGRYPISGVQFLYVGEENLTVAFANPISAFGFYGTDIGDFGGQLTLTLTDTNGVTSVLNIPHTIGSNGSTDGNDLYYGFYDMSTFYTQVVFGNSAGAGVDGYGIDNLSIGYATPLPAALPLFASGMGGVMGLLGWRRKRKKAAAIAGA